MKHFSNSFQPHKQNGKYANAPFEKPDPIVVPTLLMKAWQYSHTVKTLLKRPHLPTFTVSDRAVHEAHPHLTIQWLGHATFLLEYHHIRIILDPVLRHKSFFFAMKESRIFATSVEQSVDLCCVSHNHWDHCNLNDIQRLAGHAEYPLQVCVPQGDAPLMRPIHNLEVTQFDWWMHKSFTLRDVNVTATFLPAWHWSQRGLMDRNKSLWGSWILEFPDLTIYFAGDTAYANHFRIIGETFPIDYAILPIAPCKPRKWLDATHMDANQALLAFFELQARHFIPAHWGTYAFGAEAAYEPVMILMEAWDSCYRRLPAQKIHLLSRTA